jgi:hypothetical protein
MPLTLVDCQATTNSITIVFSDAVEAGSATTPGNYSVFDPSSVAFKVPKVLTAGDLSGAGITVAASAPNVVVIPFAATPFSPGDWVTVVVSKVNASKAAVAGIGASGQAIGTLVNGKHALKIVNCTAAASSVTVYFSEHLDVPPPPVPPAKKAPNDPTLETNYVIQPQTAGAPVIAVTSATYDSAGKSTFLQFSGTQLQRGQWVVIIVKNVAAGGLAIQNGGKDTFFVRVDGDEGGITKKAKEVTEAVEDAVAYPLLTEQVSLPSSSGGAPTTVSVPSGPSGGSLGQIATKAITDVLGWKINATDPKGFVGALTQSFTLTEVEGHVKSKWTPRTYAVQTDLSGGITGAQASIYLRAKDALDKALPLLDGLYALDPEADPEDVKALREMARNQMSEIVQGLGDISGPPVLRINTYFQILLGYGTVDFNNPTPPVFDPDKIKGTLGTLRDTYGIYFKGNPFSNSIEDEQDITNFRIISDYMTSLLQSWLSNGQFFVLGGTTEAFFGTQLVLISRQFSVISETVEEVRFTLESVWIARSEQATLLLEFVDPSLPAMFIDDMLMQVSDFCREEGPRLLQDGGRLSVNNNILPVAKSLRHLVNQARRPTNLGSLPDGYKTVRVQRALDDLHDQLKALIGLARPIGRDVPPPDAAPLTALSIISVTPASVNGAYTPLVLPVMIIGTGFKPAAQCTFNRPGAPVISVTSFAVTSPNFIVAVLAIPSAVGTGKVNYDVQVDNQDGRAPQTLIGGFTVNY